jgi:hypothetical protein
MTDQEMQVVSHSRIQYAAHMYQYVSGHKKHFIGLGLVLQGIVQRIEKFFQLEKKDVKQYFILCADTMIGGRAFMYSIVDGGSQMFGH